MSNDDTSWLSEPHTQALFMQFPLPLAIVGRDGSIKHLNRCFNQTFESSCLQSGQLQKLLKESAGELSETVSFQCGQCATEVFVRTVGVGDNLILVLEKSGQDVHSAELNSLHRRVLELEKISALDRLTGAWNRAHFDRLLGIELARSLRYRQPASLIFLDIDHFKNVNDTQGHAVGDRVLCELVKVIDANIRASDMLFRWGGEEFVVLATATSYRAAGALAENLRCRVAEHEIPTAGHIHISLGVAEYQSGENEEGWFKRADAALYAAKNGGRNRVVVDERGNSDAWTARADTLLHLAWHESYNSGQPDIDAEHQGLFDLANALMNAMFTRGEKPWEFDRVLKKLLSSLVQHFADEEAILAERHYVNLELHARAHKRLVERALQLHEATLTGGVTMGELVDFLVDEVVARHMLKMDREFHFLFKS